MTPAPRVCVVGSGVVDLVATVARRPEPGETVIGTDFGMHVGGKGVNQAVAAARAGARTTFIGKVGEDEFGDRVEQTLREVGVDTRWLLRSGDRPTGVGLPLVEPSGQNSIVFVSGANDTLTDDELRAAAQAIRDADVVLLQLELPVQTAQTVVALAASASATVVLNPAPAQPLDDALLRAVDVVVPNEIELGQLVGTDLTRERQVDAAWQRFRALGVGALVVTLGEDGVQIVSDDVRLRLEPHDVVALDTVGAGDAFCGHLAAQLAAGVPLVDAVRAANAAGAVAVTRRGAAPSMPSRADVDAMLLDPSTVRAPLGVEP